MKKNRRFAWLLICTMFLSLFGNNIGYMTNVHATETTQEDATEDTEDSEDITDEDTENEDTTDDSENTDDNQEDSDSSPIPDKITQASAIYDESVGSITLSYTKTDCEYVDIRISIGDDTECTITKYCQNTYVYPVTQLGKEYIFTIIPYSNDTAPIPDENAAVEVSCSVSTQKSTIQTMSVTYDMEEHNLLIQWTGSHITSVDIYQDNVKIATVTDNDEYEKKVVLQEFTTYQYKIITFNSTGEEGDCRTYNLKVDRYPAIISDIDAEYNSETRQIELSWDSAYTSSVDILLNDIEIVTGWKESEYNINYQVQPGAQYVISFIPYNISGTAGETTEIAFSDGDFAIPNAPELELQSAPILDKTKCHTGFYQPAIDIILDVQPGAVYEIYRATTDKKSAYSWLTTVTAGEEDTYTYRDSTVGVKTYYYKVLRKVAEDDYIESEILTGLSESSEIEVDIPDAELSGKLLENGKIELLLNVDCDYVSGYDIYRKAGKGSYQKIATTASASYTDTNIVFDTMYYYKAKAYYYDSKTGQKSYGSYSPVFTIRNTIGELTMDVTPLNGNKVKISWNKAGNAVKYDVYYKTDTPGDSYELLTSTSKLNVKKTLKSKTTYYFVVKAYRKNSKGKIYFSEAQITYETDFSKPQGLAVTKTSHSVEENALIQHSSLQWKRVYKAEGYYVEAYDKTTGEYNVVKKIRGASKTSCTVTDIVPANTISDETSSTASYRVVAFKGSNFLASEPIDVVLQLATPTTRKIKVKSSKVTIRWKQVPAAEKYLVYRTCGRGMQLIGETTNLSIVDSTTKLGVTYTYYVQAANQTLGYTSEYSNPVNYTRNPVAVKQLKATNRAGRKVVLTWNKVKNADSYIIYYSTTKNGDYQKLATIKPSKTQYTHTNLTKWRTYYYKIVTVVTTSSGVSAESEAKKASITISR